jgi:hypothetical protein
MVYHGKVERGVVVLREGEGLPEGTEVIVVPQAPATEGSEPGQGIWDALSELGRWTETQDSDLPDDLATNHDHYLHGLPKRR